VDLTGLSAHVVSLRVAGETAAALRASGEGALGAVGNANPSDNAFVFADNIRWGGWQIAVSGLG
jgi:hypothetical protein